MGDVTERINKFWNLLAPVALILLFFWLAIVPHHIPNYGTIKPDFLLIIIFYWSVHRPGIMKPSVCFLIGLLLDIFSAFPLGLNALIFVIIQKLISDQRRIFLGQPYYVSWIGFTLMCLLANAIKVGVFYLINDGLTGLEEIYLNTMITIAIFPIVTILLIGSHKLMLRAERKDV